MTDPESIAETPYVSRQAHEQEIHTMDEYESLSHTKWECKYHVVLIPKCRRKDAVCGLAKAFGRGVPETGRTKGEPD